MFSYLNIYQTIHICRLRSNPWFASVPTNPDVQYFSFLNFTLFNDVYFICAVFESQNGTLRMFFNFLFNNEHIKIPPLMIRLFLHRLYNLALNFVWKLWYKNFYPEPPAHHFCLSVYYQFPGHMRSTSSRDKCGGLSVNYPFPGHMGRAMSLIVARRVGRNQMN